MKVYHLNRVEDVSNISGTGIVAEVCVFTDGAAIVHWIAGATKQGVSSTVIYQSVDDLLKVHGHGGATVLEEVRG